MTIRGPSGLRLAFADMRKPHAMSFCSLLPDAAHLVLISAHSHDYFETQVGIHVYTRERKMRTKLFCTNFLNTARGPGHPGKIPGTSRIPLFETQGRQSFEGGHEVFGHHPFAWKTPTPPDGLRTQNLIFVLFFLA